MTGIITGDITGGLAGAGAPWVAEQIKLHTGKMDKDGNWQTDSPLANLVAHAVLGAVVAELQGNSGVVGGASAVSGELAAPIIQKALYGDRGIKDLTEDEKENLSALTQLAIGLTIASMGGDSSDITTGVNSSKNAVENNNFATSVIIKPTIKVCFEMQACKKQVVDRIINIAQLSGVVLKESDIDINTIESYIDIFDIPDITSLIMPSSLGSPVTIRGVDVLVKNGVDIVEAEDFLNSLSFEKRRLMDLATSDLMGNEFYEEAVLKTFEEYYPEYQKKKSSNKNKDTDNALTGSTSGAASGGAMPPDDDNDKDRKYKVKKPGVSGKDGAKDVPGWAKEYRPYVGENGKQFAKRLMDKKYGKGNYRTGTDTEFSKIKKWGDRSFMDPK